MSEVKAATLEVKLDRPVYRTGVSFAGGIAKHLYLEILKGSKTESVFSDGGTTISSWNHRKGKFIECTESIHAIGRQIDYECRVFAPNTRAVAAPTFLVLPLDNFKPYADDFIDLSNNYPATVPKGAVFFSGARDSILDGFVIEGDFAQAIFDVNLKDVEERKEFYVNGRAVTREFDNVRCRLRTVAYEGEKVRSEYDCWVSRIQKANTVAAGTMLVLTEAGELRISK